METNKYWILTGWSIFDYLDKQSHIIAIENIWECVTISWNITFFKEIKEWVIIESNILSRRVVWNKCHITIEIQGNNFETFVIANFVFISKK